MAEQAHKAGTMLAGLFFCLASGMPCVTAQAADMQVGNILPGGGMIQKKIISMRERRYTHIVPQNTDFSCGAAALATILKYAYGRDVSEEEVIHGLLEVSDPEIVRVKGFSLLDIKHYAEKIGMRGRGYRIAMEQLETLRAPTIALMDMRGYKHFVVVAKTEAGKVYIADPALGNRIIDKNTFGSEWNGMVFAIFGQGFDRNSVLLNPPGPLTARNLVNTFRPLTDAELLDFGFAHADLF